MYDTITKLLYYGSVTVFDFETTGFNPKPFNKDGEPRVPDVPIQLGAIKCHLDKDNSGKYILREERVFDRYINIYRPLPPEITEITGITDEVLWEKGLSESEVYREWRDFLGIPVFVAGYNSSFDVSFADYMAQRYGERFEPWSNIDVFKMAKHCVPKSLVPNHKLGTVAEFYGINANFHNAMEDVRATKELLEIFINKYVNEDSVYINNFVNN